MNKSQENDVKISNINRRNFLKYSAAAGTGLIFAPTIFAQSATSKAKEVSLALVGVGKQGKIVLDLLLKIPGVKMTAVCDIWEYGQRLGSGLCKKYGQEVTVFDDYRKMLDTHKGLDGVVIATPDFVHHEMTNACLQSGLHVYCEKEMSNDIEKARSMVLTARQAGKLLQIGHQRRSNPFYKHAYNLMHKDKVFGDITTVQAQWNQQKPLLPVPKKMLTNYALSPAKLKEWGFSSMEEFYYWRWFNKYAGGPMTDLGSHQVDVFCWYLDTHPSSVTAIGGSDFAKAEAKANNVGYVPECFDHTFALYEFETKAGTVSAFYQVNLTSSHGGFYEVFMGVKGSMDISEIKDKHAMFKERGAAAAEWEDEAEIFEVGGEQAMKFDPLKSRKAKGQMDKEGIEMGEDMEKPAHQPHLENFVEAIRSGVALNCPGEVGFETAVTVLKANESAVSGKKIKMTAAEFKA
jgi:predicted dehydrogenase